MNMLSMKICQMLKKTKNYNLYMENYGKLLVPHMYIVVFGFAHTILCNLKKSLK